jgi:hypothetical protein
MAECENDVKQLKDLYKLNAVDSDDLDSIWNELLPSIDRTRSVVRDELESRRQFDKDLQSASQLSNLDQSNNTDQYSSEEQDDDETEGERCVPRQAQQVNRECYQFQKYDRYINSSC